MAWSGVCVPNTSCTVFRNMTQNLDTLDLIGLSARESGCTADDIGTFELHGWLEEHPSPVLVWHVAEKQSKLYI